MLDVLEFMLPDQVWALSHHLEAPAHPIFCKLVKNQIWYMKGKNGFPWDMNTFDDQFIYQSITERDWDNPDHFKIFASTSWPGANGGIVWSPRDAEAIGHGGPWVTPDSTYRLYSGCDNFTEQDLQPVSVTLEGPYEYDFGGDLGWMPCLVQRYFWTEKQTADRMELNRYIRKFGWAQWELWHLQGNRYEQKQISAFNHIADGGSPDPLFPCGVPEINGKKGPRRT
jgi:hypothetical protein